MGKYDDYYSAIDEIKESIKRELYGTDESEVLEDIEPLSTYVTGILFARKASETSLSDYSTDNYNANDDVNLEDKLDGDDSIIGANKYKPSSMGISVAIPCELKQLNVIFNFGVYRNEEIKKEIELPSENGNSTKKEIRTEYYYRTPQQIETYFEIPQSLSMIKKDFFVTVSNSTMIHLEINLTVRKILNNANKLVTVSVVNKTVEKNELHIRNESVMFQCKLILNSNLSFLPVYQNSFLNHDIESQIRALLYSSIKNYAYGHGCSVEYDENSEDIVTIGVFNKSALSENKGYHCTGKHPHLGENISFECDCIPTVRLRSSSSVYFPINYSALLIPPWSQEAFYQIEKEYKHLVYIPEQNIQSFLSNEVLPKCHRLSLEDLLLAYKTIKERRELGKERSEADIYEDEYRILCKNNIDEERYSSHFVTIPDDFKNFFDIVSVLDRLVVTLTLEGFSRLHPYTGGANEKIAPLSQETKEWLPAVELNGEGIFIKFNDDAIDKWCQKNSARYAEMKKAHHSSFLKSAKFSDKYVMLHSFAHLFIRQLSNECGYSAASIREKIYSDFTDGTSNFRMNGILVYLSSSDSDGSLGGLVSVAEETDILERVLKNMLTEARWCSAGPLCSSAKHQGFASLNYAACHACTLLPETSCEIQNVLLDRISVVGKTEDSETGFFGEILNNI